jgi:hypothetical protein
MQELDLENVIVEYAYTGITGQIYHPTIKNGKWYINPLNGPVTFYDVVYLCRIPDDDALMLRLKYGG